MADRPYIVDEELEQHLRELMSARPAGFTAILAALERLAGQLADTERIIRSDEKRALAWECLVKALGVAVARSARVMPPL